MRELDLIFADQKMPEYLAINPLGQIPSLVSNSVSITQTTAIMRHIARLGNEEHKNHPNHLLGSSLYENALVDQWFDFINL